jgi:ABC-type polysaccharide/polyol phosphate export permease
MSCPVGVTILAGLQFFYSGIGLFVSLAILLIKPYRDGLIKASMQILSNNPQLQGTQISTEFMQGSLMIGAGVGILFSLVGLVLGYGLLKLKSWAWICTLILQVLQILSGLQSISTVVGSSSMPGISISQQIFQLILSGAIIYYLFRRDVKQAFGRSTANND